MGAEIQEAVAAADAPKLKEVSGTQLCINGLLRDAEWHATHHLIDVW